MTKPLPSVNGSDAMHVIIDSPQIEVSVLL